MRYTTRFLLIWLILTLMAAVITAQDDFSGGLIVFSSFGPTDSDLYLIQSGGKITRLTTDPAYDLSPAWSPDGTQIVFSSDRSGAKEIYVMNADGSDVHVLTDSRRTPGNKEAASWSPDGTQIAFQNVLNATYDLYVMNSDGSNVRALTDDETFDFSPAWSPDGRLIAFSSNRDDDDFEIYVMNPDGGNVRALTDNDARDYTPAWSPDGTMITFESDRSGNYEIYVMNADGSNVRRLTDDPTSDYAASWSPDGTQILFTSGRDGETDLLDSDIYVMNADGSNVRRLTDQDALTARWQPVPAKSSSGGSTPGTAPEPPPTRR